MEFKERDPQQPPRLTYSQRGREALGVFHRMVGVHVACLSPFLRKRIGYRVYAWDGPLAMLILMPLYGGLSGRLDMFVYEFAWILAVIYQRIKADYSRHSMDMGDPALAMRVFRCGTQPGYAAEPFIALLAGLAIYQVSAPVGLFVMAGLITLGADYVLIRAAMAARKIRLRDAAIEQRFISEQLKNDEW